MFAVWLFLKDERDKGTHDSNGSSYQKDSSRLPKILLQAVGSWFGYRKMFSKS